MISHHRRSVMLGRRTRRGSDRGFSMIEVLVSMVMAVLAITTVCLVAVGTNKNQRQSQAYDSATQTANGIVEIARSLAWPTLGFATNSPGFRANSPDGKTTVVVANPIPALVPLTNATKSGAPCTAGATGCQTIRTDIVWLRQPSAPNVVPAVLGKEQIQVTVTSVDLSAPVVTTVTRSQTSAEAFTQVQPPTLILGALNGGYQIRLTWNAPGARSVLQLQRSATADFANPVVIASPDLSTDHGLFTDLAPIAGAYNYYRVHTTVAAGGNSDSPTAQIYAPPLLSLPTLPGAGALTWDTVKNPDTTSITLQQGTIAAGFATPSNTPLAANATSAPITFALNDTRIFRLMIGVGDGSTVYSNTVTPVSIPTPVLTLGTVDSVTGTAQVSWNIAPSKFAVPRAGLVLGNAPAVDLQSPTATSGTLALSNPADDSVRNVDTPATLVLEAADGTVIGRSNAVTVNFAPINFAATPDNMNIAMGLSWASTGQSLGATAVTLERSDNAGFVGAPVSLPVDLTSSAVIDTTAGRGTPYWYRLTFTDQDGVTITPIVIGPKSIQAIPTVAITSVPGTSTGSVTWDPGLVTSFGADQVWVDTSGTSDFSAGVTSTQITNPAQSSAATIAYAPGNVYTQIRFLKGGTEVDTNTASFLAPNVPTATQIDNFELINQAVYELDRAPSFYGWTGATITATFTGSPGSVQNAAPGAVLTTTPNNGVTSTQVVTLDANTKSFSLNTPPYPADLTYTITATGPGGPASTYAPVSAPDSFRSASTCDAPCVLVAAPTTNPDDSSDTWDGNPPAYPNTSSAAPESYWNDSSYALRYDWTSAAPESISGTSIVYIDGSGIVELCSRFTSVDGSGTTTTTRPCTNLGTGQRQQGTAAPVAFLDMQTDGNLVAYAANGAYVWATGTFSPPVGLGTVYQLTFEGDPADITNGGILRLYRSAVAGVNPVAMWDSVNGRSY